MIIYEFTQVLKCHIEVLHTATTPMLCYASPFWSGSDYCSPTNVRLSVVEKMAPARMNWYRKRRKYAAKSHNTQYSHPCCIFAQLLIQNNQGFGSSVHGSCDSSVPSKLFLPSSHQLLSPFFLGVSTPLSLFAFAATAASASMIPLL